MSGLTEPQRRALAVLARRPAYASNHTTPVDYATPEGAGYVHVGALGALLELRFARYPTDGPYGSLVARITDAGRAESPVSTEGFSAPNETMET